jgi:hypothetical protein
VTYVLLAALAPLTAAVVTGTDERLVATAAGLGLLGALVGAGRDGLVGRAQPHACRRDAARLGLGRHGARSRAAPLGLLAGGALLLLERTRR